MSSLRYGYFVPVVVLMLLALGGVAAAQGAGGQVYAVHGIPDTPVDVYVNGEATIEGFNYGDVAGPLDLPAGDYELAITPAGESVDNAVLTDAVSVTDGLNATVVAHLSGDGSPTLSVFPNDTSTIPAGESRLVVRHLAAAPTVDILLADGTELFTGLAPGDEAQTEVPAGTYDVEIVPAGAGVEESVFTASGVNLPAGTSVIVNATGDLEAGSFDLVVQTISDLGAAPSGVPSGSGDLAGSGVGLWLVVAALAALAGLAFALPRALRS